MKPTNNKSLLHFLFSQMEKLDKKEITVDEAKAMSGLAKNVNTAMKYELDRARVSFEIEQAKSDVKIREVEVNNPET